MEQCQFCNNMFGDIKMLKQHQKKTKYCLKIQEAQAKEEADAKKRKEEEELILKEKTKELTCKFCSKEFKTKYLLNKHQTQTKYCLLLQESQNSKEIVKSFVTCKFCNKNFSSSTFNRHDSTCKKKNQFLLNQKDDENVRLKAEKNEEISILKMKAEKDQEISILKMKVEKDQEITRLKVQKAEEISLIYKAAADRAQATNDEIAKKPTYQKNIQNNLMISSLTPLDLSQARVDSIIDEKYTKNDFYEGQKGAAQVVYKYLSTDSNGKSQIVCTDTERGTFHHIDVNGEHVVDYKNSHLINRVHLPLKRKASKFAAEESVKNPSAFKDIIMSESSIRELETKPGLFNRTMAKLTGKNCAKTLTQQLDLSITEEWLLENAKFLTIEHILRGPEGYADYALSYPLNNRLIIDEDDDSEPTFLKFKNGSGEIIIDYGANILSKMIFESLREQIIFLLNNTEHFFSKIDTIFMEEFTRILMDNI